MIGIKDFKLPATCFDCKFSVIGNVHTKCICTGTFHLDDTTKERMPNCPLVELTNSPIHSESAFIKNTMLDEIAEMESLKADYEEKGCDPVVIEACTNMINRAKRGYVRGLETKNIEKIKYIVANMVNSQKACNMSNVNCQAELLIYELLYGKRQL